MQAAAGSDEHRGDVGEHGGFLVPDGAVLAGTLRVGVDDPIGPRTTPIPMDEPTVAVPARVDKDHSTSVSAGLTVARRRQTTAITSSRMEFGQVSLKATTLQGLTFATGELADITPKALAAALAAGFRDETSGVRLNERINGTGSGEPLGVLAAPCLLTVSEGGRAISRLDHRRQHHGDGLAHVELCRRGLAGTPGHAGAADPGEVHRRPALSIFTC